MELDSDLEERGCSSAATSAPGKRELRGARLVLINYKKISTGLSVYVRERERERERENVIVHNICILINIFITNNVGVFIHSNSFYYLYFISFFLRCDFLGLAPENVDEEGQRK